MYSARYAGRHGDDAANNAKLLREMAALTGEARAAYYVSTAVLADPTGKVIASAEGRCTGSLWTRPRGIGRLRLRPALSRAGIRQDFRRTAGRGEAVDEPSSAGVRAAASRHRARGPLMSLFRLNADIAAFRHYLQSERGLSDNTVQAYGRDLDRYANWCALVRFANYTAPTLKDLGRYLSFLHDEELAPPSVARHLVALKMFYRFLRIEERADAAAVDLLGSPKLWERIPQVLPPPRSRNC